MYLFNFNRIYATLCGLFRRIDVVYIYLYIMQSTTSATQTEDKKPYAHTNMRIKLSIFFCVRARVSSCMRRNINIRQIFFCLSPFQMAFVFSPIHTIYSKWQNWIYKHIASTSTSTSYKTFELQIEFSFLCYTVTFVGRSHICSHYRSNAFFCLLLVVVSFLFLVMIYRCQ